MLGRPIMTPRDTQREGGPVGSASDLAPLFDDPTRTLVPVSAPPLLLTAASADRERIGAVARALLARLTGEGRK